MVTHQVKGFLGAQTVYFLLNFNLAHRQIWITRHVRITPFDLVYIFEYLKLTNSIVKGESTDNVLGKIGGDAPLSDEGKKYARALTSFMECKFLTPLKRKSLFTCLVFLKLVENSRRSAHNFQTTPITET